MEETNGLEIAIIGMDGRFPGAKNTDQLWENIKEGKESISHFSEEELLGLGISKAEINNPNYIRVKGVIDDPECFDADFFNYSAKEAKLIDPQSRVFLETSWKAMEDSGYSVSNYNGIIGVYAGMSMNTYILQLAAQNKLSGFDNFDIMLGNDKDLLSTRVSYKLNLKGPSVTVQSTCSTSLVAVHMACQSLLSGECDMAIAGGVSIQFPLKQGYTYREGMIHSKDGHCRPFADDASGTVFSDGVGAVVLKRLEDALEDNDSIYSVIKGSAINNDGADKVGFTAPSISGQSKVIKDALILSGINPETIQYVETHGTGTKLGDPIEVRALTNIYTQSNLEKQYCAIGSIKANIGHLNTAAGVAGLIKTTLALKNKQLPPSININQQNHELHLTDGPFYINKGLKHWNVAGHLRRAGVSSFGIGGTNAHLILEEIEEVSEEEKDNYHLIPISAKTKRALTQIGKDLENHLERNPFINIKDLACTLSVGREQFNYRAAFVANNSNGLVNEINRNLDKTIHNINENKEPPVYFLFPGQGSQYVNMGKELYEKEPAFKKVMDECAQLLKMKIGVNILDILYPYDNEIEGSSRLLEETKITQPVIFSIEYALAKMLLSWGIKPAGMIGHSLGEYVAACLAEVMSLEDALTIIAERGSLIQNQPYGSMLAVRLSSDEAESYLDTDISIAASNGPKLCVLSGTDQAIESVEKRLKSEGVFSQRLKTSHAFHSQMMDDVIAPFKDLINKYKLNQPKIPFVSNVTGEYITSKEATSVTYWAQHIRKPVLFNNSIKHLLTEEGAILLEVGPGKTLIGLAQQQMGQKGTFLNLLPHQYEKTSDCYHLLNSIGELWTRGIAVDFPSMINSSFKRVNLPTYPFEKEKYSLLEGNLTTSQSKQIDSMANEKIHSMINVNRQSLGNKYIGPRDETEQILTALLEQVLGMTGISVIDDFFELGGNSLIASQYVASINDKLFINLSIETIIECGNIESLALKVNEILVEEIDSMTDEEVHQVLKGRS